MRQKPKLNSFPYVNIYDSIISELTSTRFGELNTAYRTSQMNFKPTWGISQFRYIAASGSGATIGEVNGEFKLSTGPSASVSASLQTLQRGQYQAGAMGQAGIGVRIPVSPIGSQYARWGYYDDNNGFGFGVDSTGNYIFYKYSGSLNKIYQNGINGTGWDGDDKLNGSGSSELTLNLADGIISHIDFSWYGYGDIDYVYFPYNPESGDTVRIPIHHLKIFGSASIVDPNQPLTFEVNNGSQTSSSFSLFIGGHQFSIIDGGTIPQKRQVSQLITDYTTATNTNWQPLIALRKKFTHGPSNRTNSVRINVKKAEVSANGELETRITYKGITTTGSFVTLTGWTSSETAAEVKTTQNYILTASPEGFPTMYGYVDQSGGGTNIAKSTTDVDLPIGYGDEVIFWIRRLTASGAIIVKNAHLDWEEEW